MKKQFEILMCLPVMFGLSLGTNSAFAAETSKSGLPQLDYTTWPSQIFWLVMLFTIGYVIMARIVIPRIGTVLEERHNKLNGDLSKAREANEDAAKIRANYEKTLENARADAAAHAKEVAAKATQAAEAANAKLSKKLATKAAVAETKLAKIRADALDNLNTVAAESARAIVRQLAGINATTAQAEETVKSLAKTMTPQENN